MRKRPRLVLASVAGLILVGMLIAVVLPRVTHANSWTVCASGCNYTSINAAISAAGTVSGDTISIGPGTYNEQVSITKDGLTLQGAGAASTIIQNTTSPGTGVGIAFSGAHSNITIEDLKITGFQDGIETTTGPMSNVLLQDMETSGNARHGYWCQAFTVTNLKLLRVTANNNGTSANAGRGFWIINGAKTNITVQDSTFNNNGLVGIDLSDGNVTGATITGNTVTGNGDSGIAVLGAQGPGANLIDGNTVGNNGRFGIEIKNPNGSGATSGAGSIVVSNNDVYRNQAATDPRDYAGIAVIRRGPDPTYNVDQPTGVVVSDNFVSGFNREPSGSTGDGFGIVVEGLNEQVLTNFVVGNDVGIQVQGGNTANVQGTDYFDRGNAAQGVATMTSNIVQANGIGVRAITAITNASPMITARTNCITENATLGGKNDLSTGGATFDAKSNWWGAASGPFNATSNPSGTGNGVSNNIDFSSFLTQTADVCTSPNVTVTPSSPHYTAGGTTYVTSATVLTVSGSMPAGSSYSIDSVSYRACATSCVSNPAYTNGPNNSTLKLSGSDGTYEVDGVAFATNNYAGDTQASFVLDNTAPTVSVSGVQNGSTYPQPGPLTITFSAADSGSGVNSSSVSAKLDGKSVSSGQSLDLTTLAIGSHTLVVSAADNVGNSTTKTITFTVSGPTGLSGAGVGAQPVQPSGPTGGQVVNNPNAGGTSSGTTGNTTSTSAGTRSGMNPLVLLLLLLLLGGMAAGSFVVLRRRGLLTR